MLTLNRYRVCLPQRPAIYVAGPNPMAVVQACVGEGVSVSEQSRGPRWVRYRVGRDLPAKWPEEMEGTGGGNVVDVEDHGPMRVVLP